jgi:cell division septation protein DedD
MEDQTTWKGHTFTLLVFTGIVVLCSIFFILGMLVGRTQGQKIASNPAQTPALKVDAQPAKEDKPDFTFYDSVKKTEPAVLETPPPPKSKAPAVTAPAPKPDPVPDPPQSVTSKPSNIYNLQIGAVKKSADAQKLLQGVKKKGFRAFILSPAVGDNPAVYRVQVGPFSDLNAAQDAKRKLENAGYQTLLKK